MRRLIRQVGSTAQRHGWRRTLYAIGLRALGHHRWFRILRAHVLEEVDASFLELRPSYTSGFLGARALGEATWEGTEMSDAFLQYALAKNDKCYAFTHHGAVVSYGWYATSPTRALEELNVHFSRDYVYIYKAFTREEHRGERLYPIGMMRALKHYRSAGYKGLLLYVDANNLASLRACAQSGFRPFGTIVVFKLLNRYFVYESPGCADYGFRLEQTSTEEAVTAPASKGQSALPAQR